MADDETEVETLIAGRAKRTTAGNRLTLLLEKEDDDELELLFAEDEDEEDVEFEGENGEVASDVELGSSSDEDQGPTAGGDDLDGEKEIQRQQRADRKKKRKALETFKRPRPRVARAVMDSARKSSTPMSASLRIDKKKSDRLSWLPAQDDGALRSSSRRQTVQNKQVVHQRLEESEKRRRQQLEVMEAAAERRKASRPKAMSQADRIAEAARIERQNAKSLNRWEAEEKKRAEEQKAKLDALKNRKLEGPVISWWSGPSTWTNGKLFAVGTPRLVEEFKESTQGSKVKFKVNPSTNVRNDGPASGIEDITMTDTAGTKLGHIDDVELPLTTDNTAQPIAQESSMCLDSAFGTEIIHASSYNAIDAQTSPEQFSSQMMIPETLNDTELVSLPPPLPPPPVTEVLSRNLIILENIESGGSRVPEMHNHILLKRKATKLSKAVQETCPITGLAARFRDPKTGIVYHDAYAYKEIQKACSGNSRWSNLLGCYVGPAVGAATGVPEHFYGQPEGL